MNAEYSIATPPLILSHQSAVEFWRSHSMPTASHALSKEEASLALNAARGNMHVRWLRATLQDGRLEKLPKPVGLLANSRQERRTTKLATIHCVLTQLPEGSLVEVGPLSGSEAQPQKAQGDEAQTEEAQSEASPSRFSGRLLVATPELCLVQMASVLPTWELIELAFELCGSYALSPASPRGYIPRTPLSTPEKLRDFAGSATGIRGAKLARTAAKWVVAGARSPEEARICMLAHLPRSLGGMGTKGPRLGARIPAPDAATRIIGSRVFTPDLYWPDANIVLDYAGRSMPSPEAQSSYNRQLSNAYRMASIEVVPISRTDLADYPGIAKRFELINRRCGTRLKPANAKQQARQQALLSWMLKKAM